MDHTGTSVAGGGRWRQRAQWWTAVPVGVLIAAAAVPGVAAADPPTSGSSSGASISCSGAQQVDVWVSQGDGWSFVDMSIWSEGGPGLFGSAEEFSYDGTTLDAAVDLYAWGEGEGEGEGDGHGEGEGEGEPVFVGTAAITATFTAVGDPEVYEDDGRDGNRLFRFSETYQQAEVSGMIVLDGILDIDLSACEASQYATSYWQTDPAASVYRFSGTFLECAVEVPQGSGHLYASTDGSEAWADLFVETADGFWFGFTDQATFTDAALTASIDLFEESFDGEEHDEEHDEWPGGEPVATAAVAATLVSQGTETQRIRFPDGRVKETIETFSVTGTVTVDGAEWQMVDCFAEAYNVHQQFVDPNGPKTKGPPPANDLPADAEQVEVGDTVRARTNTAVPPPEAPCVASFSEEGEVWEYDVPLGKTLWYVVTATDTTLTMDTAGSDFDTVVGVYDTALEQVACVDDVGDETGFSLQAAATIDTVPGETYLVQVGGYGYVPEEPEWDPDYGRLFLTVTG